MKYLPLGILLLGLMVRSAWARLDQLVGPDRINNISSTPPGVEAGNQNLNATESADNGTKLSDEGGQKGSESDQCQADGEVNNNAGSAAASNPATAPEAPGFFGRAAKSFQCSSTLATVSASLAVSSGVSFATSAKQRAASEDANAVAGANNGFANQISPGRNQGYTGVDYSGLSTSSPRDGNGDGRVDLNEFKLATGTGGAEAEKLFDRYAAKGGLGDSYDQALTATQNGQDPYAALAKTQPQFIGMTNDTSDAGYANNVNALINNMKDKLIASGLDPEAVRQDLLQSHGLASVGAGSTISEEKSENSAKETLPGDTSAVTTAQTTGPNSSTEPSSESMNSKDPGLDWSLLSGSLQKKPKHVADLGETASGWLRGRSIETAQDRLARDRALASSKGSMPLLFLMVSRNYARTFR